AHGVAMQCRVTTEDPANNFLPDYGRLSHYRSASGLGIRLDAGTAFTGAVITPFYDSLLVKVTASGLRFVDAARHMERCLQEFRVRVVKTNIPILIKLVTHPKFLEGQFTTRFIDETPELFQYPHRQDRATKLLTYIGEIIVNGNPVLAKTGMRNEERGTRSEEQRWKIPSEMRQPAPVPPLPKPRFASDQGASTFDRRSTFPPGTRDKLQE